MWMNNANYCDYCFLPKEPNCKCPNCGLFPGEYQTDADLLRVGSNLNGKYIIGHTLGRGGFGVTYLAYSSDRKKPVAIKEYFPNQIACRAKGEMKVSIVSNEKVDVFRKGAKRFFDEAKTMSKFENAENIVKVYEFFYYNDTAYYSMEYLQGIDLKGYIQKNGGRIDENEAIRIMKAVSEALIAIHSTGTLHRDISPDNIFICNDGTVKLIDFGAAKQVIGEQSQSLSVILKQGFAPYEQYQKNGNQGMWTDIYALGSTMYYAVTGKIPEDAVSRVQNPTVRFDSKYNITKEFEHIIDKCMRMKISDRFQSALELLKELNGLSSKENGGNTVFWNNTSNDQNTYIPTSGSSTQQKKDRSELIKKIIIIVGTLFIVAMLVTVFIELMKPAGVASDVQQGIKNCLNMSVEQICKIKLAVTEVI